MLLDFVLEKTKNSLQTSRPENCRPQTGRFSARRLPKADVNPHLVRGPAARVPHACQTKEKIDDHHPVYESRQLHRNHRHRDL